MSKFLNTKMSDLKPYTPGEQPKNEKLIKLNTNESPFPPSKMVKEAISKYDIEKLRLYPDPEAKELIEVAAKFYNVGENQIIAGNGSDEILAFIFMAYGNEILYPEISYGFYSVYANMFSKQIREIPLSKELRILPKDYFGAEGNIIIANPNAPTGIELKASEIESIILNNPNRLIVIDEAYIDFGAESMVQYIKKYENLLVVQTMSKSRSLAGARIGFAIGNEELIKDLRRIKYSFNPYNINSTSIIAGIASILDNEYFIDCCESIKKTRENFISNLEKQNFKVLPSKANFIFAKPLFMTTIEYNDILRKNNILVRHFSNSLIKDYLRITIGTNEEMNEIIKLNKFLLSK